MEQVTKLDQQLKNLGFHRLSVELATRAYKLLEATKQEKGRASAYCLYENRRIGEEVIPSLTYKKKAEELRDAYNRGDLDFLRATDGSRTDPIKAPGQAISKRKMLSRLKRDALKVLWWPRWEEVPLDLFHTHGPRTIFVSGGAYSWDVVLEEGAYRIKVSGPCEAVRWERLASLLGEDGVKLFDELRAEWKSTIHEYFSWARPVRAQVEEGERSLGTRARRALRESESRLHELRESILRLLEG